MTSLCISSIPAEVLARPDHRSSRRHTALSSSPSRPTSPKATATPSAEAPREYAIDL
jgi:hypothetical protein